MKEITSLFLRKIYVKGQDYKNRSSIPTSWWLSKRSSL